MAMPQGQHPEFRNSTECLNRIFHPHSENKIGFEASGVREFAHSNEVLINSAAVY